MKYIKYVLITLIYWLGCLFYSKKYLKGKYFNRYHFSLGWKWILKYWWSQKVFGKNKKVPFPVPNTVGFGNPENIIFDVDDMANMHQIGCYYQGIGAKVTIGKGTYIAQNCGFITANHDLNDLSKSAPAKNIKIGKNCWIGMNSVILPGVELGDHTVVGAGSIVTKSFKEGNCIIVGNPAKLLRKIDGVEKQ